MYSRCFRWFPGPLAPSGKSYDPDNPKVAVERTGGREIQVDIKSKATTNYLQRYIYKTVGAHRPCLYMLGYPNSK